MYDYLVGKVVSIGSNYIILEVNSVGYKIYITDNTSIKLNCFVKIYIYYFFNESVKQLYGFINKIEREVFSKLLDVKKIGVKTSFLILSKYFYRDLLDLVNNGIEEEILKIPKITKDNYKSLIEKLSNISYENNFNINVELLSILRSLEYQDKDIFKIYKSIDSKRDIKDQVKDAIRLLEEL